MAHAVQQRHHRGVRADRRGDRLDRRVEVVGLAGQQHDVVGPAFGALQHRLHLLGDVALGALDHQAVALQRLAPRRTNQESDVGAALVQASADIAADRASAQNQDSHFNAPRARRAS
jgi:hypothetical protein